MNEWIDLTVLIDESYKSYPGDEIIHYENEKNISNNGYNLKRINTNMHVGTHIDVKKHVFDINEGIESININKVIGLGTVIKPKIIDNIINTQDIINKYNSKSKILILNLRNSIKLNLDNNYNNFPKFERNFLSFLIENKIELIGLDIPSPEYVNENFLAMHKDLLGNNILIIENLCNLDKLKNEFEFIALPLKIKSFDGSMIRCVAKNH